MSEINNCELCPRKCGIDREISKGFCGADSDIIIARAAPHMWEEPCISGKNGSGAVFFSGCNLHCVYCQNKQISDGGVGKKVTVEQLAQIFLDLQAQNVYNINLVTPTHYALAIKKAVKMARDGIKRGSKTGTKGADHVTLCNEHKLQIPIVYNCGGYESADMVRELNDTVDIWMPDFKYMSPETAKRYSNCPDYFERATEALDEMVKQVREKGGSAFRNTRLPQKDCNANDETAGYNYDETAGCNIIENDESLIMTRGVIVRHMLLPEHVGESKRVLRFLHERYGNDIFISIMSQYTPMPHILSNETFPELHRKVSKDEYARLVDFAVKIGIEKAFIQEGEVATDSFIPAFDGTGVHAT